MATVVPPPRSRSPSACRPRSVGAPSLSAPAGPPPAPRRHRTQLGQLVIALSAGWGARHRKAPGFGATMRPATCAGPRSSAPTSGSSTGLPAVLDERDPSPPVRLAFPDGARLSRAAVLFRLVLVLPAALLATLSELGIMVAAFFIWVVVLVAGECLSPYSVSSPPCSASAADQRVLLAPRHRVPRRPPR